MGVVLWHLELSHYSEKARWALDFKGVAHERRSPLPGLHQLYGLWLTRGAQRRMPVLEIDGRRIGDSTAIIAALEAFAPEPALYPAGADERERALALEDWLDCELGEEVRRLVWHHMLSDPELVQEGMFGDSPPVPERILRIATPLTERFIRRDFRIDPAHAALMEERILAVMTRLESELQPSGYLVGDSFTVADLTAAALFTPLLAPPLRPFLPRRDAPRVLELRAELEARPGGRWVHEMYARHRGAPALAAA